MLVNLWGKHTVWKQNHIWFLFVAKELRTEVENLAARLHYMEEAKEDVRADIAVMRRAAEKADTEVTKAELEKKKQVWYSLINR